MNQESKFTTVGDAIESLTRFQLPVYNYIVDRTIENGVPPTMREVAHAMNVSPTNIHHHVHKIMDTGLLVREPNRRGYKIIGLSVMLDLDTPIYTPEDNDND